MNKKGLLIVLSGPAGSGKGSILKEVLESRDDTVISISATTRKPRPMEEHSKHYYFLSKDEFEDEIHKDNMLEWVVFADNYYGTPKTEINRLLDKGINVVLEIEVQGALKVRSKFPEGVYIFVLAPTFEILKQRLIGRNTETAEVIEKRLNIAKNEVSQIDKYNYIIVNDDLSAAASKLNAIIDAEQQRMERNYDYVKEVFFND